MRKFYPAIIAVCVLLSAWAALLGPSLLVDDCVEISREKVYAHADFTREVFAGCPIEKAQLNVDTNELTVFYPREEYRDLIERLQRQGWTEQGAQSGRYRLGDGVIVVERGALTILPGSLASR